MKTYTVQQIAEMLNTSDETVRRWIRGNKLTAQPYSSRKAGSIVSEEALAAFLHNKPKYKKRVAEDEAGLLSDMSSAVIMTSVAFITAFLSRSISQMPDEGKRKKMEIPELKRKLRKEVKQLEHLLEEKEQERQELKTKLDELESRIWHIKNNLEGCNYILTHEDALKKAASGDPSYTPF